MSTKSEPISDVFSAGIIFHYLLFGHSVFPEKNIMMFFLKIEAVISHFSQLNMNQ